MSKELRLAIVGCGFVAQMDYFPVLQREDVRSKVAVVGLCDTYPGRAEELATRLGFGQGFTDLTTMIRETKPDLVALLSPIPYHFDQAMTCFEAGVNVYVQKTMTETLDQAQQLCSKAEETGLLLTASPGQILDASHQEALRLIADDRIGKLCFARGQGPHSGHEHGTLANVDPSWYYSAGNGPLPDVAVYPLTSLTTLMGPVQSVQARSVCAIDRRSWNGNEIPIAEDDTWVLSLGFANGALGQVSANFVSRKFNTPQVEIFGASGVLQLGGWTRSDVKLEAYLDADDKPGPRDWQQVDIPSLPEGVRPTVADLLHTVDVLGAGEKLLLSHRQALHVIEVIDAARVSARTDTTVPVHSTFDSPQF